MTEQGLYDIYKGWHVPFWQRPWFFWLVVLCGWVVAGYCVLIIVEKIRDKKKRVSVWQQALQELSVLQGQSVSSKEEIKKLYFSLTEIVKKYLYQRFTFDVQGKTDEEMLDYLKRTSLPEDVQVDLALITRGSLMIKFANAQAMQEQIGRDIEKSISIIKRTIPSEQSN